MSLYLHFFRAWSQWFIDGKSEGDRLQNGQSAEEARLGTSVFSHLKNSPVACSYRVPGNTGKKQITVLPLYFNSYFCIAYNDVRGWLRIMLFQWEQLIWGQKLVRTLSDTEQCFWFSCTDSSVFIGLQHVNHPEVIWKGRIWISQLNWQRA